jgi:antitoxin component of RelBE/YafQ-DinJ toxin-antitoxin module
VIRSLLSAATIALVAFSLTAVAQESALPVDRNSQEVRDAQKQCTEELKHQLLKEKVRKTIFGAEEEAFQRCKKITGWQSPQ